MKKGNFIYFYNENDSHGFLSNYFLSSFIIDGLIWPSSEHYYQAKKHKDKETQELIRQCETPDQARTLSRNIGYNITLEDKYRIMREAIWHKFYQSQFLRDKLLATGNTLLIEDSDIDSFWGNGRDRSGLNILGLLLMEVRSKFLDIEMSKRQSKKMIIVDLEATCCDDDSIPKDESEIIEIGAVYVEKHGSKWKTVSEFSSFVKPQKHPTLHPFCTDLTKITQEMVDAAPLYHEAYLDFENWLKSIYKDDVSFGCWGIYDYKQIDKECQENGIDFFLKHYEFVNLKVYHAKKQNFKKGRGVGLRGALRNHQMQFEGTPHRAISDTQNIARLLNYCL